MTPNRETTVDGILGRRLMIEQPLKGFRVAVDTPLTAAAVPAFPGDRVLELGSGVGALALAIARRVPDVTVIGIERDPWLAWLADGNATRNGLADRVRIIPAESADLPSEAGGSFEHVVFNPPFHAAGEGRASPIPRKAQSTHAALDLLLGWLSISKRRLAHLGYVTFLHRGDTAPLVEAALRRMGFSAVRMRPLLAHAGESPLRRLWQARVGLEWSLTIERPLVLHLSDGHFTAEAEAILRNMAPLPFGAGERA